MFAACNNASLLFFFLNVSIAYDTKMKPKET